MATVSEEPVDFKCKIESVCHVGTDTFEVQTCADHEEARQQIIPELKQESQSSEECRLQSEGNNEEMRIVVKYEICPDNTVCANETGEENCGNIDTSEHAADANMDVANGISEEMQIESESICIVDDTFLKIKKGEDIGTAEVTGEDSSVNYDGDESSSVPENVNHNNEEEPAVRETAADFTYVAVDEHADFEWAKLFTPAQTKFPYPEDEKEIEKLAAVLWQKRFRLLGRDLHDIITTCNYASQWKTISEESKHYVFQRLSLLYLAVTRGWRYALVASDPDNGYSKKRLAIERPRGGFRPRKRRHMAHRPTPIQNQQTDQVVSTQQ